VNKKITIVGVAKTETLVTQFTTRSVVDITTILVGAIIVSVTVIQAILHIRDIETIHTPLRTSDIIPNAIFTARLGHIHTRVSELESTVFLRIKSNFFYTLEILLASKLLIINTVALVTKSDAPITIITPDAVEGVSTVCAVHTHHAVIAVVAMINIETLIAQLTVARKAAVNATDRLHRVIQIVPIA
jgi:hypothetical protein